MKYQYFRISLIENPQPDLFEVVDRDSRIPARHEFLIDVFTKRMDFTHRKSNFVFAPIGQNELQDGVICLGRIGRQKPEYVNLPPEQNFEAVEQQFWRASNILIDTRGGADGQIIAIQKNSSVGIPYSIISSLTDYLNNSTPAKPWLIEINPISEERDFWTAYRQNKGEVSYVEFDFVTPNGLGITTSIVDDLKEARKKHNAQRLRVGLTNKRGALNLEGEDIRNAAEYVTAGGGSAKIKAGRRVVYDSTKMERTVEVSEDEPLSPQRQSVWGRLISVIF